MDWYTESRESAREHFPDNWELFLAFLAVTSVNTTVKANVTLALKAWKQNENGADFRGYLTAVITNLERAKNGESLTGPKVRAFYAALLGDKNAVVVDRWMARAYGFDKVTSANYPKIEALIRQDAKTQKQAPSDFQAILWAKIKTGSAESFAPILKRKLAQKSLF